LGAVNRKIKMARKGVKGGKKKKIDKPRKIDKKVASGPKQWVPQNGDNSTKISCYLHPEARRPETLKKGVGRAKNCEKEGLGFGRKWSNGRTTGDLKSKTIQKLKKSNPRKRGALDACQQKR